MQIEDSNEKGQNNKEKAQEFERKLAQLLFIVGHAALKLLIYVDKIE